MRPTTLIAWGLIVVAVLTLAVGGSMERSVSGMLTSVASDLAHICGGAR